MGDGASANERLLAAARLDNEEMLLEVFDEGGFDINYKDGLGNTALHYAASKGSTDVLEHILSHEDCDVDPINRLEGATPLHLAIRLSDPEVRKYVVGSLLEAGADTTIKDKNGETVWDQIPPNDQELRNMLQKASARSSVLTGDVVDDDDDDGEGSEGSGSDDD